MSPATSTRKSVDYERIEPGWRAGLKSPAQLAAQYEAETGQSVSRTAIIKHFEALGVPRDLSAKIKAKADSLVAASMVANKVSPATKKRDAEIVDAGAKVVAAVRIEHRADIAKARSLAVRLVNELEAQTANLPGLVALGEILRNPGERGEDKLNDVYRAVISLPERAKTLKVLAESQKHLIGLEREAYGLDSEAPPAAVSELTDEQLTERFRRLAALAMAP